MTQKRVTRTGLLLMDLRLLLRKTISKTVFTSSTVVGTEKTLKTREKKGDWVRPASKINDALRTDSFGFVLRGKKIARYGTGDM